MSKQMVLGGLALMSVVALSLTTWADDAVETRKKPTKKPVIEASGAELFRTNCTGCHGPQGKGTQVAPGIANVLDRMPETKVRAILASGGERMPSFAHLSAPEIDAILTWVRDHEQGTRTRATLPKLKGAALGKRLFRSNCASCHQTVAVKNPKPGPASLLNVTRRWSKAQIMNVIKNGVCTMPSFGHLQDEELKGLYAFLETLVDAKAPLQMGGCGKAGACGKVKAAMAKTYVPTKKAKKPAPSCGNHGPKTAEAPRASIPKKGCGGCKSGGCSKSVKASAPKKKPQPKKTKPWF